MACVTAAVRRSRDGLFQTPRPEKITVFWVRGARFGYASGSASFACDDCLEPLPRPPSNTFGAYRAFAPCLMRPLPPAGVPSLI
jgi:hypothetical protein